MSLGNARAVPSTCRKRIAAAKLMANIEAAGEQVGILVNNAGFGQIGQFAELDPSARAANDRPQLRGT